MISIQGWAQQPSLEEFDNLLLSQELLAKQLASEFVKEREENALVADKRNVRGKTRDMPHSRLSSGSSSPGKKEEFYDNYGKRPLRCYRCGKVGHIRRYFQATESNVDLMKKVVEEEEGWERCLEAESRAINTVASINLERDWIRSNTIHNVEQEGPDKNQEATEYIHTGDVVAAIEEIKAANLEIGRKSLNVKDVEVDSEETISENQYASDDIIGESIKGDIVKVEVLDQSSIISRSIIGSEQILEVDEKVKDLMNDEAPISYGEIYNMIKELEMKSSGGFFYDTKDSQKINDQIIIESNKEATTDKIFLYYGVALERVSSKILNPRALNFSIPCVSPGNQVVGEVIERESSRTQHHKTQQGKIDDEESSLLK